MKRNSLKFSRITLAGIIAICIYLAPTIQTLQANTNLTVETQHYSYNVVIQKKYIRNSKVWSSYQGTDWSISVDDRVNVVNFKQGIAKDLIVFRNKGIYFLTDTGKNGNDKVSMANERYTRTNQLFELPCSANIKNTLTAQLTKMDSFFSDEIESSELAKSSCLLHKKTLTCTFSFNIISNKEFTLENLSFGQ